MAAVDDEGAGREVAEFSFGGNYPDQFGRTSELACKIQTERNNSKPNANLGRAEILDRGKV
jgi:hypothetical protein